MIATPIKIEEKDDEMDMNKKRKSLLAKILLFIGGPVAVAYCVVGVITLNSVEQSVTDLAEKELTASSRAASNEIGGSFAGYIEVAKQMSSNTQFEDLFLNTPPGTDISLAPGFAEAYEQTCPIRRIYVRIGLGRQ